DVCSSDLTSPRAALRCCGLAGEAPARPQYRKAARGDVAAHGVEYRVAARHRPREVLRTIVDDGVRAEPAHVVVVGRARGADYARAEVLGELDREPGHASRAAVDQHG